MEQRRREPDSEDEMTDNLALWQAVEKTPPAHTKPITGKSYSGTSPKPHYLVWKATETFGPIGIGWGFTIVDERIEDGAGGERLHIARVRVWYKWNGERGEVEHIGGTSFSGTRASGKTYTDEDAPKKSVTDALIKALSMIGFAGDIFMGRYDDSKYVAEIRAEADAEKRAADQAKAPPSRRHPQQPAGVDAARQKAVDFRDSFIADIRRCGNLDDLRMLKTDSAKAKAQQALADRHRDLWDDVQAAIAKHETSILERSAA
jgi:hypothetical protein